MPPSKSEERVQEKIQKAAGDLFTSKDNIELPRDLSNVDEVSAFLEKIKRSLIHYEKIIDAKTGDVEKLGEENRKFKKVLSISAMFLQSLVNDLSIAGGSATQVIRQILPLIPQIDEAKAPPT